MAPRSQPTPCLQTEGPPGARHWQVTLVAIFLGILLVHPALRGAEEPPQKTLFLPKSPTAAAYVLARLSNKELIQAPRSEFVFVALLQRSGLERKFRLEALEGLAKARNTTPLAELIQGITDLDKKGEETAPVLRELASILLQSKPSDLATKRDELEQLAKDAESALGRQTGCAALVSMSGSAEKIWQQLEAEPSRLADLILSVPSVRDLTVRASFYPKIEPLLKKEDAPEIRQAAITAITSLPGHDQQTFLMLASLIKAGTERPTAVASLQRIARKSWPKDQIDPLLDSLLGYLRSVPVEKRTEPDVINSFQLASDLASLLPTERASSVSKTLRSIGVSVFVIRTIHEQMLYDTARLVVEAGKPIEIILKNEDAMPHNLVVVTPNSAEEIGRAAEKLPEPDAEGRIHVPKSPKVLHATKMIDAGQEAKLSFTAPDEPGDYQYVCTFPGHWMRMLGTLVVVKDVETYLASQPTTPPPTLTEWKMADFETDLQKVTVGRNLPGGKESFSKLACIQCHKLGKEGYAYGPDLTDVLNRWKGDRASVLGEILEPARTITDRYKNYTFELSDGDEISGMIVKEENGDMTVHTGPSDALIRQLKKSTIKQQVAQGSSLMPMGLLNQLTKDQILDLLAFIESGGNAAGQEHNH